MCTVSFLPHPSGGFLLTSSRDEHITRPAAAHPRRYRLGGRSVFFPRDPLAGGTWIATDERHHTLCLLNGAFEAHVPRPPYRQSRGQVILDFFGHETSTIFLSNADFSGLEPFTLLIVSHEPTPALRELRWDGHRRHEFLPDARYPHLWSSATLYGPTARAQRLGWFQDWLGGRSRYDQDAVLEFHQQAGLPEKPHYALRMHRPDGIQTVSITSVERSPEAHRLVYQDLQAGTLTTFRILS
jgi:hypothetical protein